MTHDQQYTIEVLRQILEYSDQFSRLNNNNSRTLTGEDVFEIRMGGKHWDFIAINDNGRVRII